MGWEGGGGSCTLCTVTVEVVLRTSGNGDVQIEHVPHTFLSTGLDWMACQSVSSSRRCQGPSLPPPSLLPIYPHLVTIFSTTVHPITQHACPHCLHFTLLRASHAPCPSNPTGIKKTDEFLNILPVKGTVPRDFFLPFSDSNPFEPVIHRLK